MIWWLRVRRWPWILLALAAVCGVGYQYGALALPVPPVFGEIPPTPVAVLLPIVLTSATMAVLPEPDDFRRERSAARPLILLDIVLVAAVVLLVHATTSVVGTVTSWPHADLLTRNTAGLMGAALLARLLTSGQAASIAVAGYAVACTVLFPGRWTLARWWAWPVDLDQHADATRIAVGLLLLGLAALALGPGGARRALPTGPFGRNRAPRRRGG